MKKQQVEFKVGKSTLRGTVFIPNGKGPFPSIINFHGNGSKGKKYFEWGEKFAIQGYLAFAFNFRGCGNSDGDYLIQTHKDALKDGETAFKFLLEQKQVDAGRIGLIGGSFGGFIASMLLPEIKIESLILLAPSACTHKSSARLDEGGLKEEVKYFKNKDNWFNSKSYENISKFTKPLLIIKSEYDDNVPSDVVDRYFEQGFNSKERKIKIINGADHRLSETWMKDEAFEDMNKWFLDTL